MERKEIEKLVIAVICKALGNEERNVTLDSTLIDDLHFDSLDAIELAMEFEKRTGVFIPDDTIYDNKWLTSSVKDVVDTVCILMEETTPENKIVPGMVVEHRNKESQSGYSHDGQYIVKREVRMKDFTTGKWYDAVEYESIELPHERYVREKSDFKDKFKEVR